MLFLPTDDSWLLDNGFNIKVVVKPFESNIFNLRSDA